MSSCTHGVSNKNKNNIKFNVIKIGQIFFQTFQLEQMSHMESKENKQ